MKLAGPRKAMRGIAAAATIWQVVSQRRSVTSPPLTDLLSAVPRMVTQTVQGDYDGLPLPKLVLMGAGLAYVVSPVDLLPEALLLAVGAADDVVLLGWIASAVVEETEKFLVWERSRA